MWWASLLGAGAQATNSGLGNLWSAKERRIQHSFMRQMFENETGENQKAANLAWERELDYKARMNALKSAGINPYMVASQGTSAPQAQGASTGTPGTAPYTPMNLDSAVQSMLQSKLIQAQKDNIESQTDYTKTQTNMVDLERRLKQTYEPIERTLGIDNAKSTIANLNETLVQIKQNVKNMETTNELTLQNIISTKIGNYLNQKLADLQIEAQTLNNRHSQALIKKTNTEIVQISTMSQKLLADIQLIQTQIENNKLTGNQIIEQTNKIKTEIINNKSLNRNINAQFLKIIAETQKEFEQATTERDLRNSRRNSLDRSNLPKWMQSIRGAGQDLQGTYRYYKSK